jgi:polysaccharide chain length determinant protein (PEP-CTERM system associated)
MNFDLLRYLEIARRRIYYIMLPFLCALLGGLGYILITPKIYEAHTLILVQPQNVPRDYVRSVVSSDITERLRTITQQVTSRTNLEKVIAEFNLFGDARNSNLHDPATLLKKSIKIDMSRAGRGEGVAFTISFRGADPKKVKQVTDWLAGNFISENLLIRESQAQGTSAFLGDELESARMRLAEKEEQLKRYQEEYLGGLPENLETNLRVLERTQTQIEKLLDRLRDLENRKMEIQRELSGMENRPPPLAWSGMPQAEDARDLASLRNQLASITSKYTEFHPDVIKLKKTIARLESETSGSTDPNAPASSRANLTAKQQILEIDFEIRKLKVSIEKANEQITLYNEKIEDTPHRAQELLSLNRDYANLNELYNSLLKRKLEAEIAVSMEKKQHGEQFRVIDPAKEPLTPVTPSLPKIILMTLTLGLGLGCALAYGVEMLDSSFKAPEDLEKAFKIPVLVSIPMRYTAKEYRIQRRVKFIKAFSVAFGFLFSACGIILAAKGVENTLSFGKTLLDRVSFYLLALLTYGTQMI